jgi:hypothetical protein
MESLLDLVGIVSKKKLHFLKYMKEKQFLGNHCFAEKIN